MHNFYIRVDAKNSFLTPIRTFHNIGRIVNRSLVQAAGKVACWGHEHSPSPMALCEDIIAVLADGRAYPEIWIEPPKIIHDVMTIRAILDPEYLLSPSCFEVYNYTSEPSLPPLFIFRNTDRCRGAKLLKVFEGVYSRQVLSATSVRVHCGAITSGAACDDRFSKLWPRGMGLDYSRTSCMAWLFFSGNPLSRCAHGVLGVGSRRRADSWYRERAAAVSAQCTNPA